MNLCLFLKIEESKKILIFTVFIDLGKYIDTLEPQTQKVLE
jgi:hypothetical protein